MDHHDEPRFESRQVPDSAVTEWRTVCSCGWHSEWCYTATRAFAGFAIHVSEVSPTITVHVDSTNQLD